MTLTKKELKEVKSEALRLIRTIKRNEPAVKAVINRILDNIKREIGY